MSWIGLWRSSWRKWTSRKPRNWCLWLAQRIGRICWTRVCSGQADSIKWFIWESVRTMRQGVRFWRLNWGNFNFSLKSARWNRVFPEILVERIFMGWSKKRSWLLVKGKLGKPMKNFKGEKMRAWLLNNLLKICSWMIKIAFRLLFKNRIF
jgi:hypothetical protein